MTDATDCQLLQRFVAEGDESAFAALARRHGARVRGVCRRVLRDEHEAEDVCQATFLVHNKNPVKSKKSGRLPHLCRVICTG